ncbi:hypothetical protein [Amycolatopsis samaneae]|uniref:Uncharacterized protein n=1 Tax=Amycolatopsis samaneae TaxID=664691 RepID=A0ABW5GUG2_9PSEU
MTDEIGVITGDVTIRTSDRSDGTAEWYTVTGSPISIPDGGLDALHTQVTDAVREGEQPVAYAAVDDTYVPMKS